MITLEVQSPSTSNLLTLASSVPIGQSAIVHTEGRNDMGTSQILMFHWVVWDPDGVIALEDTDKTLFGVPPGGTEERMTPRFDLGKEGTYTLKADLLMNPDNPVIVDSYEGDLCTVTTEIPPEYELLEETIYPYAYVYDGDCDFGIFTFKSDPFTPASWIAGKFAAVAEAEVKKAGGRVLETRVYVDKTPLLWTNWRIEIIGISPPTTAMGVAGMGITVGIAPWVAAILVILALCLLVVLTYKFIIEPLTYKHKPISPKIKEGMSREWLILTIGEFEARLIDEGELPGPPTPPEELEEKSDGELRDYCDQLAEWIAPPEEEPEVPWGLIAVVGVLGLGAVGVGAALAAKPKGKP